MLQTIHLYIPFRNLSGKPTSNCFDFTCLNIYFGVEHKELRVHVKSHLEKFILRKLFFLLCTTSAGLHTKAPIEAGGGWWMIISVSLCIFFTVLFAFSSHESSQKKIGAARELLKSICVLKGALELTFSRKRWWWLGKDQKINSRKLFQGKMSKNKNRKKGVKLLKAKQPKRRILKDLVKLKNEKAATKPNRNQIRRKKESRREGKVQENLNKSKCARSWSCYWVTAKEKERRWGAADSDRNFN